MDNDQTVFENPVAQNLEVKPVEQVSPVQQQPQVVASNAGNLPPDNSPKNTNKLLAYGGILKVLIGLAVVLIIAIIIFFIVVPLFNKKSAGPIALTYWGLWEDAKTMQPIIADFEKQNPGVTVNYVKEDIKQYRETLTTRINNGTGPDIFTYHNSWYPMFSSVLLPFSENTMSKQEFINSFYPAAQMDLIKNGAIYGIPTETDTLAMYVNTDIFKSAGIDPPKTWNDFVDDARALTVKDENGKIITSGAAIGTYDNVTHAPDIISLLFLQNNADLKDITKTPDRIQGALNFYTSFATDENNVWDNTLDPSILSFSKGNLAMFFGYSWDFFTIKAYNPNLNFKIVPAPQLPNQDINLASYWAAGVSIKSQNQKYALLFLKYLAQKQAEENLYLQESKERAFGEPYARVDLAQALKDNPFVYPFVLQSQTARSSYFVDSTNDNGLNQQLNTYLDNAINSVINGDSLESSFSTFSQGVSQVLQKYGAK